MIHFILTDPVIPLGQEDLCFARDDADCQPHKILLAHLLNLPTVTTAVVQAYRYLNSGPSPPPRPAAPPGTLPVPNRSSGQRAGTVQLRLVTVLSFSN